MRWWKAMVSAESMTVARMLWVGLKASLLMNCLLRMWFLMERSIAVNLSVLIIKSNYGKSINREDGIEIR